ncbi:phosphatase PAP2 family protein [Eubacterium oxidoreducens]|uniref:Undecaprenyl-diphosphatase n=1 Tax=Eubacterium oxidoreducens TaxID=1732 RepID=A0A1G6BVP0_EUBOX|nr:phosphatase PAP2 family protein [Eubacterium oxidoreducens]SDB24665.1 undecaprenyl-diphosphatase [Eubacterium oxidoreducens]
MENRTRRCKLVTLILLIIFIAYTLLLKVVDVQAIGPQGSEVGFATFNSMVYQVVGSNELCYDVSKYIGYLAIVIAIFFVILAILQFARSRELSKVDLSLKVLIVFYVLVGICYVLFEFLVINYRPVLEDGQLAASYPSSHTMLALCVFVTARMQFKSRFMEGFARGFLVILFDVLSVVMVCTRLASGVHWATDIIGGILLSAVLIFIYRTIIMVRKERIW